MPRRCSAANAQRITAHCPMARARNHADADADAAKPIHQPSEPASASPTSSPVTHRPHAQLPTAGLVPTGSSQQNAPLMRMLRTAVRCCRKSSRVAACCTRLQHVRTLLQRAALAVPDAWPASRADRRTSRRTHAAASPSCLLQAPAAGPTWGGAAHETWSHGRSTGHRNIASTWPATSGAAYNAETCRQHDAWHAR